MQILNPRGRPYTGMDEINRRPTLSIYYFKQSGRKDRTAAFWGKGIFRVLPLAVSRVPGVSSPLTISSLHVLVQGYVRLPIFSMRGLEDKPTQMDQCGHCQIPRAGCYRPACLEFGRFCPKENTVFLFLSGGRVSSLDMPAFNISVTREGEKETFLHADEAIYPSRRVQKVESGIKGIYAPPSSSLHLICSDLFCQGATTCDCNVVGYAALG
jgi:hypothetical protein